MDTRIIFSSKDGKTYSAPIISMHKQVEYATSYSIGSTGLMHVPSPLDISIEVVFYADNMIDLPAVRDEVVIDSWDIIPMKGTVNAINVHVNGAHSAPEIQISLSSLENINPIPIFMRTVFIPED